MKDLKMPGTNPLCLVQFLPGEKAIYEARPELCIEKSYNLHDMKNIYYNILSKYSAWQAGDPGHVSTYNTRAPNVQPGDLIPSFCRVFNKTRN